MNALIKALLLAASMMLASGSAMAAKDDAKPAGADKAAASAATGDKATSKSDSGAKGKSAAATIDLNSASEDELKALPQIGDARAKAIVNGRPYARKDELVSKKILTQKQYDGIKDKEIARQGGAAASSGASSSDKGGSSSASGKRAASAGAADNAKPDAAADKKK